MHNLMQQLQTLQLNMPHGDPPPNEDAEIEEDEDPPHRPAGRGRGGRGLGFANFGHPHRIPIGGGGDYDGDDDMLSDMVDEFHNVFADPNLDTCGYSAEDGTFELGLNCLAIQPIPTFAHNYILQDVISPSSDEITSADFDELLADFSDFEPSTMNTPSPSLVVRRVLSTQFVAAEQG